MRKPSHLDADGSLSHLHVSNSLRDVVPLRLSSGDQIALSKLHCLEPEAVKFQLVFLVFVI